MKHPPHAVLFGVSDLPAGAKLVLLGVPEAGWQWMKDGKTHTFDLTKLGIPVQIMLFGGKDQADLKAQLAIGPDVRDLSSKDMGIDQGKPDDN